MRPDGYSDESRLLLEHMWALIGCPCGKDLMLGLWLPLLAEAGDLDKPFATREAIGELEAMNAAPIDRYPGRLGGRCSCGGPPPPRPSPLPRNPIGLSKVGDALATTPGRVIEADTGAQCGPTFQGEFARTLTMTGLVTGWTENASIRNNASKWIVQAVADLEVMFPFPLVIFGTHNGRIAAAIQPRSVPADIVRPWTNGRTSSTG